jgi:hypothetical protein
MVPYSGGCITPGPVSEDPAGVCPAAIWQSNADPSIVAYIASRGHTLRDGWIGSPGCGTHFFAIDADPLAPAGVGCGGYIINQTIGGANVTRQWADNVMGLLDAMAAGTWQQWCIDKGWGSTPAPITHAPTGPGTLPVSYGTTPASQPQTQPGTTTTGSGIPTPHPTVQPGEVSIGERVRASLERVASGETGMFGIPWLGWIGIAGVIYFMTRSK